MQGVSEKTKSKILMAVSVAVIVFIVLFAATRRDFGGDGVAPPDGVAPGSDVPQVEVETPTGLPPSAKKIIKSEYTAAPVGSAPAGFPWRLLIGSGIKIEGGETIDYAAGFLQNSVSYSSSDSVTSIFSKFKVYFENNGWVITNEITGSEGGRGLYAEKGDAIASVSIVKQSGGSRVGVSYVEKMN